MPMQINHLAASGSEEKFPEGPIISPNPGPTLLIDVAEAEIAVLKSRPILPKILAIKAKIKIYRKKKFITESVTDSGSGFLL